jgi:hypothetical protein
MQDRDPDLEDEDISDQDRERSGGPGSPGRGR